MKNKSAWIRAGASVGAAVIIATMTIAVWIFEQKYKKLEQRIDACAQYVADEIQHIEDEIQEIVEEFNIRHLVSHSLINDH